MTPSKYLDKHYFDSQTSWVAPNVPLNPVMRGDFDMTPNTDRDPLEIEHWWGIPYIVTFPYEMTDRSYQAYLDRLKTYGIANIDTEIDWLRREEERKNSWFKKWPSGVRFDVRCLTGGAWDRSSSIAMVESLAKAILVATAGEIELYPLDIPG
tara:strand:+ start:33910 stop:34368 length:459 start_codon:yes stop_codon:yes gene_type:complete